MLTTTEVLYLLSFMYCNVAFCYTKIGLSQAVICTQYTKEITFDKFCMSTL